MRKKQLRMAVDIVMTVMLPMLMAYSLIGELFHEIAGVAVFILFVLHHVLNRKWYVAVSKGRYGALRVYQTVIDMLLLIIMVLQPVSGILMSKHLFTFIRIAGVSATVRALHLCLAYWGLVLLCLHAGGHLAGLARRLLNKNRVAAAVTFILCAAVSVYGIMAFTRRQIAGYMVLKTAFAFFDFSAPRIFFFIDYISVMILFGSAGCLITYLLTMADRKRG